MFSWEQLLIFSWADECSHNNATAKALEKHKKNKIIKNRPSKCSESNRFSLWTESSPFKLATAMLVLNENHKLNQFTYCSQFQTLEDYPIYWSWDLVDVCSRVFAQIHDISQNHNVYFICRCFQQLWLLTTKWKKTNINVIEIKM